MHFGVTMFPADYAMNVVDLGRAAEGLGFESLFLPEHTHIPTSRRTPRPGGGELPLPDEYAHTLDPFVALGAVAAATSRLKLGTGICLLIQRDPIITAKEVASVDHLSGGRFLFGIGAGWNREEVESHGTTFKTRWRLLREQVAAMKAIWAEEEAEFHGELVDFGPLWSWPKPIQRPHPPILMGGDLPQTMRRVIEYADEWMPHPGRGEQSTAERVAAFHALCQEAGRAPMPVTMYGAPAEPAEVESYRAAGVARCVFRLPPADADAVLPVLERCAAVARDFRD